MLALALLESCRRLLLLMTWPGLEDDLSDVVTSATSIADTEVGLGNAAG